MMWWKVVEAIAGLIAAAICLVGRIRRQSPVTLVFGAMSLAIIWMLLFGPATEAATYILIAVPSAYLVIFGWCEISETVTSDNEYSNVCRVRWGECTKLLVSHQKGHLSRPCDTTLLRSLLLRRTLFLVDTADC